MEHHASGATLPVPVTRGTLFMALLQRLMGLLAFQSAEESVKSMPDAASLLASRRWVILGILFRREAALAAGMDASSRLRQLLHAGATAMKPLGFEAPGRCGRRSLQDSSLSCVLRAAPPV